MTRKIVIAGNSTFPLDANIGMQVVDVMREFGEDVVFLTRGSQGFDQFVIAVAMILGRPVLQFPAGGGADNLRRDLELIEKGDVVLAFLTYETMHDERTGTAMLIEKALNAKKPTRAYTCVDGQLVWAGETDEAPV